jgi:hypothetical protein
LITTVPADSATPHQDNHQGQYILDSVEAESYKDGFPTEREVLHHSHTDRQTSRDTDLVGLRAEDTVVGVGAPSRSFAGAESLRMVAVGSYRSRDGRREAGHRELVGWTEVDHMGVGNDLETGRMKVDWKVCRRKEVVGGKVIVRTSFARESCRRVGCCEPRKVVEGVGCRRYVLCHWVDRMLAGQSPCTLLAGCYAASIRSCFLAI